jgi:hypothetical protein
MNKIKKIIIFIFIFLIFVLGNNSWAWMGWWVAGQGQSQQGGQGQFKPSEIKVEFKTIPGQICPPGILGTGPCSYPTLEDIANKIINLILNISPYLLTFLLVLGGFVYLLSPFKVEEYIKKGHNYIKYAILGYILILLLSLIFSIISAIIGGP